MIQTPAGTVCENKVADPDAVLRVTGEYVLEYVYPICVLTEGRALLVASTLTQLLRGHVPVAPKKDEGTAGVCQDDVVPFDVSTCPDAPYEPLTLNANASVTSEPPESVVVFVPELWYVNFKPSFVDKSTNLSPFLFLSETSESKVLA